MIVLRISKQPYEEFPISVTFAPELAEGETVVSAELACKRESDGADTLATIVNGAAVVASPLVTVKVRAGATGERHVITVKATTSASPPAKWEAEIVLSIKEVEFS